MKRIAMLLALWGAAIPVLPGCGGGADGSTSATPLQLSPEQAAAIKQQDSQVDQEEGGPAKQTKPAKKGGARR
ncbi:MAG: hypothetical protein U0800_18715 [Isosphaeraceae bacterium]